LRDAIKGHRSLYQDGGILHQDISPINIIITSATKDGDPKGMLIDLGMATKGPPPDNQATGTDQFMAIGVCAAYLPRNPHTYRHDLGAVWFLSIWPNTQEYRYTRRRSTFGFRPGEYSNTGIEILSI
jgi:hypothetical protein